MNKEVITKLSAIVTSVVAIGTVALGVIQLVSSRNQSNRIAAYDHHQKALQSIYAPNKSGALHVGSIYTLSALAREVPSLGFSIANELAATAIDYSTIPDINNTDMPTARSLSIESQAALQVIGTLGAMSNGLPLHLEHGYFHNASLPNEKFNGVHFWGSDLSGADFYNASLYGADLRFSRLNGASFPGAILSNAGFFGAVLCPGYNTVVSAQNTGTKVTVSMSGAKLDSADFDNAWLIGARFNSDPGRPADQRTYLFRASFRGADLEAASFQYAKIDYADFSGANLTDANFTNASGIGTVIVDRNTRLCRTIGLKIPGVIDHCSRKHDVMAGPSRCILYKTWRELETV